MRIQTASNTRAMDQAATKAVEMRRLAQADAPQKNYQPPEVDRLKASSRTASLRAPETGKGTVVDIMG